MSDNSLFSFSSDSHESLASNGVCTDRNGAIFDGRLPLPPLSVYYNSSDVFSPLQIPHQQQGTLQIPHQQQGTLQIPHQPRGTLQIPHQPQGTLQIPHQPQVALQSPHQPQGTLQIPHQPQVALQSPHQPHGTNMPLGQVQPIQGYHQGQHNGLGVVDVLGSDRHGPLTPPGSPDDQVPRQPMDQNIHHQVEVKPSLSVVAALAGVVVTDPSIAPALARALSHQKRARPRGEKKLVPDECKDERYYERRERNNLAAKKSRDSRKRREDDIAIRASFLEKENAILRAQLATLRDEAISLKHLLAIKKKYKDAV